MNNRRGQAEFGALLLAVAGVLVVPATAIADHGIDCFGQTSQHQYTGYGSDDQITGDSNADVMAGKDGQDDMDGRGGADRICGNEKVDIILGGDGDDRIDGNAGDDVVLGQENADTVRGGNGDDRVFGEFGNDELYGEADRDELTDVGGPNDYGDGGAGSNDTCESSQIETVVHCEIFT